jgi:GTP-binding protein HflX
VVDASSSDRDQQIDAVNQVLAEIGAADVPQILVWNKIDATHAAPGVERDEYGRIARVRLSAKTGAGVDLLRTALADAARLRLRDTSPAPRGVQDPSTTEHSI